jgi:hypothetical protein
MSEADLGPYAHRLLEEVRAQAETDGVDLREAFTELMLDQFCADGHAEDARPGYFADHGVEVSGWGVSSEDRCLDLFLVQYSPRADEGHKIDRSGVDSAFRRLENFLDRCVTGRAVRWNPSSEVAGMCKEISEKFSAVDKVRLVVITNARSVLREQIGPCTVQGRRVQRELWDLRRLANWAASGSRAEPIVAEFPDGLPFLDTPGSDADHRVLLAVVAGEDLAKLYAAHGSRLMELNVRSFLQLRGAVNRGILETLKHRPDRFLAYNNGIAATASSVDVNEATGCIVRIHDLQIVNGGQTTATIHHAYRNRVPLGDVFVQMKLTVVPPDLLDDIVPQISAFSNTQNRVTGSDLKANSAFHVDVERIMRSLWAPATASHPHDTHWFYERARGQYANALAREGTPARRKLFKTVNPPTQKFTKSDLAKFEHSWAMLPHLVSLGAEKNFALFSDTLDREPVTVDKDYCRHLVAKAILFRRTDRLVARQNYGGYKANIVTYTAAKLVHSTGSRIDLDRIWREQGLSTALEEAVVEVSALVQKVITQPPAGRTHVGEWAKQPECWEAIRQITWVVPETLQAELVEEDDYPAELDLVRKTAATDWSELVAWGTQTGQLTAGQCRTAAAVAHALEQGWDPAGRQLHAAMAVMRHARRNGFRPVPGF